LKSESPESALYKALSACLSCTRLLHVPTPHPVQSRQAYPASAGECGVNIPCPSFFCGLRKNSRVGYLAPSLQGLSSLHSPRSHGAPLSANSRGAFSFACSSMCPAISLISHAALSLKRDRSPESHQMVVSVPHRL